jgi:hypothetical protein
MIREFSFLYNETTGEPISTRYALRVFDDRSEPFGPSTVPSLRAATRLKNVLDHAFKGSYTRHEIAQFPPGEVVEWRYRPDQGTDAANFELIVQRGVEPGRRGLDLGLEVSFDVHHRDTIEGLASLYHCMRRAFELDTSAGSSARRFEEMLPQDLTRNA